MQQRPAPRLIGYDDSLSGITLMFPCAVTIFLHQCADAGNGITTAAIRIPGIEENLVKVSSTINMPTKQACTKARPDCEQSSPGSFSLMIHRHQRPETTSALPLIRANKPWDVHMSDGAADFTVAVDYRGSRLELH